MLIYKLQIIFTRNKITNHLNHVLTKIIAFDFYANYCFFVIYFIFQIN